MSIASGFNRNAAMRFPCSNWWIAQRAATRAVQARELMKHAGRKVLTRGRILRIQKRQSTSKKTQYDDHLQHHPTPAGESARPTVRHAIGSAMERPELELEESTFTVTSRNGGLRH